MSAFSATVCLVLPGASAKQSTIFHITLLRVLSPQQLAPADVAAVQAAVDAAAAPLVGPPASCRVTCCAALPREAHEHGRQQCWREFGS